MWDCESSRALGPNRYNFNFIKKCWNVVGNDFIACIEEFFRTGVLPRQANMTWATLIPKTDDAKKLKDYRPISIIECVYKVVSKLLANHLHVVMDGLVSKTQSTFVQGRQILDGALIANETIQWV